LSLPLIEIRDTVLTNCYLGQRPDTRLCENEYK
jgi:hypothetical protein